MTGEIRSPDARVPVTVLTGFLGVGKTTLLNRLLAEISGRRFAVIVNEFGDIGIDGDLIEAGEEELIELSSGCICCVVRGDLIRGLRTLLTEKPDLEGVIIETTGLANPSPVIQTLVIDQVIGAQCRLDSVLCVVDAVHIFDQLAEHPDTAQQIAFCDHIVLNKVDEASVPLGDIGKRLRQLNPFASITRANRSDVPAGAVLDRYGFDLDRIADQLAPDTAPDDHHHIDNHGITSVSLACEEPMDETSLEDWLQDLLARRGGDILRTKGVISIVDDDRKLVLQAVNMVLEGDYVGIWEGKRRYSRLVFIGRNLDRDHLDTGFRGCRPAMSALT